VSFFAVMRSSLYNIAARKRLAHHLAEGAVRLGGKEVVSPRIGHLRRRRR
jgi:hypothetical protein